MAFKNEWFSKKYSIILLFFFFVLLLPILIKERSQTILMAFEEGFIELILSGKIWLHGFESVFSCVFSQSLIFVFLFVVIFRNRIKIE